MRLRVLGCHGGELPKCRTTCFLVDETLALDAGALTSTLHLEELTRLEHILIGHSHFDHVKDLPLIADLLVGRRDRPVVIHASPECARTLQDNMFNNLLWPDFTRIPSRDRPVLRLEVFEHFRIFKVGAWEVLPIPVTHPVESTAFIVTNKKEKVSLAMSGDTGPTEEMWAALNSAKNLKALLLETSFPNELQGLADISGHYTPATLEKDLQKFKKRKNVPVLLYHLKPAFLSQLGREIRDVATREPVRILRLEDRFEL